MRRERTENVLPPLTKRCGGIRISIRAREEQAAEQRDQPSMLKLIWQEGIRKKS